MSRTSIIFLILGTFVAGLLGAILPSLWMTPRIGMMSGTIAVPNTGNNPATMMTGEFPMLSEALPLIGGTGGNGRHMNVSASGAVSAAPDQATIQLGVTSQAASAAAALSQNSTDTAAVIASVVALGVAEKDIQTSNFSVYPTYDTTGTRITGYQVTNSVSVTIRDLVKAGPLLDQVVQAGANNITGLNFSIADTSALVEQARTRAFEAAKAKAESMAKAAGVELGEIISITESSQNGQVYPMAKVAMDAAAGVPVQAGTQDIMVDVSIVYAIR
jgi:uncharacterized protein YggE